MRGSDTEFLSGTLEKILFCIPEKGFVIGRFQQESVSKPVVIKGTLFNVSEGVQIRIGGNWSLHPTYGKQFLVQEFALVQHTTCEGMERYLATEVPGIGKKTAARILKEFGLKTFEVIDNNPEALLKIPKISQKQYQALLVARQGESGTRAVKSFLLGVGISPHLVEKLIAHYGLTSMPMVQQNPYQLTELPGVGFRMADTIARNIGFELNSPQRASAAILYLLKQLAGDGHTCYPGLNLVQKTHEDMQIEKSVVELALTQLKQDAILESQRIPLPTDPLQQMEMISLPRFFSAEIRIGQNIHRLLETDAYVDFQNSSDSISQQEREQGITLDPKQRQAVEAALHHKILILTGGPGTGKTTIIRFILRLFGQKLSKIALAAPTGKAAKRLSEATGKTASTIHRLLEVANAQFQRNRHNPIEHDFIIIDETSMIDVLLMDALLDAVDTHARLVFVGDIDQLPSVGAGSVLSDMIASEKIAVIRLETIFRQAADSLITRNAHSIRSGQLPDLSTSNSEELRDFYFISEENPEKIVKKIIQLTTDRIPARFHFDPKNDIQVLTPMHQGITGSIHLNQQLQAALNLNEECVEQDGMKLKTGDKVMQQQNNYEKQVFNGDIGIIQKCFMDTKEVLVDFDQKQVIYKLSELSQLSLAYAISVHKSQGSEYPAILLPLTTHHFLMLQRNLLYTAITRGKKLVIVIGTKKALQLAINNADTQHRHTLLRTHLGNPQVFDNLDY